MPPTPLCARKYSGEEVVGVTVGANVGIEIVGVLVGAMVWGNVGTSVGAGVGAFVGFSDGGVVGTTGVGTAGGVDVLQIICVNSFAV